MEPTQKNKSSNGVLRAIDVSIVIVHLGVIALVVDWLFVASFNLNLLGMLLVAVPSMALVIWATVKLWAMSERGDTDQILE